MRSRYLFLVGIIAIAVFYKIVTDIADHKGQAPKSKEELQTMINSLEQQRDPRLKRIMEIQARHGDTLLDLPGVQGIGIGLDGNEFVFKLHVLKLTPDLQRALPPQIEGVRVQVVETGREIRPL